MMSDQTFHFFSTFVLLSQILSKQLFTWKESTRGVYTRMLVPLGKVSILLANYPSSWPFGQLYGAESFLLGMMVHLAKLCVVNKEFLNECCLVLFWCRHLSRSQLQIHIFQLFPNRLVTAISAAKHHCQHYNDKKAEDQHSRQYLNQIHQLHDFRSIH